MCAISPIFVLLDGVSDVRNLGAVARSAECAGAGGIILPAKGGAAINADGVKASAGALLRIGVSKCKNLRIPIYYLKERGFQIVAATEKALSEQILIFSPVKQSLVSLFDVVVAVIVSDSSEFIVIAVYTR